MSSAVHPLFPPLRLDLNNQRLWQGTNEIQLKPKASALRHYLVEHADRVVTKKELLDTVWADARISERSVKSYIKEIRQVLDDPPRRPHYVQTVHGRGYQFIGPLRHPLTVERHAHRNAHPQPSPLLAERQRSNSCMAILSRRYKVNASSCLSLARLESAKQVSWTPFLSRDKRQETFG